MEQRVISLSSSNTFGTTIEETSVSWEGLVVGEEVSNYTYHIEDFIGGTFVAIIDISVSVKEENSMTSLVAKSFNDKSSSDFVVQCQNKEFYVHQYILKQKSEYFKGLLRNECLENNEKKIVIEDFDPGVVEILLRYLYNGCVCVGDLVKAGITKVLNIADKYNFTELFDTLDSKFAQDQLLRLTSNKDITFDEIKEVIQSMDTTILPKSTAVFFIWKISERLHIIGCFFKCQYDTTKKEPSMK